MYRKELLERYLENSISKDAVSRLACSIVSFSIANGVEIEDAKNIAILCVSTKIKQLLQDEKLINELKSLTDLLNNILK